jgi:hypothetical protein
MTRFNFSVTIPRCPQKRPNDSGWSQANRSIRFCLGNPSHRNRPWRAHLFHQIVVPLAFNLEMSQRAKFHRFDQHMIEVDVNTGLTKRVESCSRASTTNEPGLEVFFWRVVEFARLPYIIAMAADEMRSAIAVSLGSEQLARFRRPSPLERSCL